MATDRARSALGADAVTPQTQDEAAAGDGFVSYDELTGPELDAARWSPPRLPTGDHLPLDPNAEVAVGQGEVRVTIPRFSLSSDTSQVADSLKYALSSTRQFQLPPDRPATFAADMAVANIGGDPGDYRRGMASFQVAGVDGSMRTFCVCGTSTRVLALHEHLEFGGTGEPFIHMIESPYADFGDDFTRFRACEVTLDRGSQTAVWRVDGHTIYTAHGTLVPEHVGISFSIWTQLPIRDGRSRSLEGQGLSARWRRFRHRGLDA